MASRIKFEKVLKIQQARKDYQRTVFDLEAKLKYSLMQTLNLKAETVNKIWDEAGAEVQAKEEGE